MRTRALGWAMAALLGSANAAFPQTWYEDYEDGIRALRERRYSRAIQLIASAIESGPDPGPRARTHGVRTIPFYPYYHLGMAYYALKQTSQALRWLEKSRDRDELREDGALATRRDTLLGELRSVGTTTTTAVQPIPPGIIRGVRIAGDGSLSGSVNGQPLSLGTYHALLIGIEDYAMDSTFASDLQTPIEDVQRLARLLIDSYGFLPQHVRFLVDEQATRAGILDALSVYSRSLGPTDNLLIYYAGHGFQQSKTSDGFWIPHDGTRSESSWISNVELQRVIKNIGTKHKLLVSDSCFSGTLTRNINVPTPDRYLPRIAGLDSSQVITSGGLEPVADGGRDGMSMFAFLLTRYLESPGRPYVTASQLFTHLAPAVSNATRSRQTPQHGKIPEATDLGGQFIFFRLN